MGATLAPPRTEPAARIGPNAVIQLVAAMQARWGERFAESLLAEATEYTPDTLPEAMIDEGEARALAHLLLDRVGAAAALPVLRDAGHRTADYLLAHRIPPPAQWVIRLLPRRLGLRLLLAAITRHAWTFAGSGRFVVRWVGTWPALVFEGCTMCRGLHGDRPMCDYYAGTFERLLAVLISPTASVVEVECQALGAATCRFRLDGMS